MSTDGTIMDIQSKKIRLLLVDDSADDRFAFRRLVGGIVDFSVEIIEAQHAMEGKGLLDANDGIDCLFLDNSLPGMSGLELLSELKESGQLENTPVVMLTGMGNQDLAVEALKIGAVDYLDKSDLGEEVLARTIKNVLAQTQLAMRIKAEEALRHVAEEMLHKAEVEKAELEGIHKVTATFAHEINNPLTGVLGMLQILVDEAVEENETKEMLRETLASAKRIKEVIHKMEALVKPEYKDYIGKTKIIDINKLD